MMDDLLSLPEGKLSFPTRPGDAPFRSLERWIDIDRKELTLEATREVKSQAVRKLELLDELHQDLVRRAKEILEKAREDIRLHQVRVYARKVRGQTYYLYRQNKNPNSEEFFSILPPEDYMRADTHAEFLGIYVLNEDSTWSKI